MLLSEILNYIRQKGIQYSAHNVVDTEINRIATVSSGDEKSLLFFRKDMPSTMDFKYGVCFVRCNGYLSLPNIIEVDDPRYVAILVANLFKPYFSQKRPLLSNRAFMTNATIGKNVVVMDGAVLGRCVIGDYTVIHPNVVIYDDVEIGSYCEIDANTTLGAEGMGQVRFDGDRLLKFPHLSKLIIKDNVLIGANVTISKGILEPTVIESGCMINALTHIAHNVHIGERTGISIGVMVCGSVKIGKGCWLSPGSIIRNQVTLGDNVTVGMGAVVTKSFYESGITLVGIPARILEKR